MTSTILYDRKADSQHANELRAASVQFESMLSYNERFAAAEAAMVEDIMDLLLAGDMNAAALFYRGHEGLAITSDWNGKGWTKWAANIADVFIDVLENKDMAIRLIALMSKCARAGTPGGPSVDELRTEARSLALAMAAKYANQAVEIE